MKTKYEFRKKALAFASKDEMQYDAVHVKVFMKTMKLILHIAKVGKRILQ